MPQTPADQIVPGDLPGHFEQEQHLRAIAQTPSWCLLCHLLAGYEHKLLESIRQRESGLVFQVVTLAYDAVLGGVHNNKTGCGTEIPHVPTP